MAKCFVGIDIGTSGVKALAVDASGRRIASVTEAFDFDRPRPGWAETPPERWWRAVEAASRRLVADLAASGSPGIAAVGLSGQMHGSVFLDAAAIEAAGRGPVSAVAPALMWNDQRTDAACVHIERTLGGRRACVEVSGCPPLCGLTAPKLLWLREHAPDAWRRVAGVCLPKDYIALLLTGCFSTDVGDASGTMLLDVAARDWSARTLAALDLRQTMLPRVMESGAVIGAVTRWASSATGIPEGTPVVIGSGDNQTAAVGAGVVDPGEVLMILGTSGVVLAPSASSRPDLTGPTPGRLNLFCDATGVAGRPGRWSLSGCMLSAAGSLAWAREVLAPDVPFDTLLHEAERAPPGCDGLVFLPYLTGERCPIPDPAARGAWVGLTRSHTRGHLVRAVVEGVSFGLAQILDIVRDVAGAPDRVRVVGGGARSALWRRVLAEACGVTVVTLEVDEGSALGAAAIAAFGVGAWPDAAAVCNDWVRTGEHTTPSGRGELDDARRVYGRLYEDLRPASAALGEIERGGVAARETLA